MSQVFEALQKAHDIHIEESVTTSLSAYGIIQAIESSTSHVREADVEPPETHTTSVTPILDTSKVTRTHRSTMPSDEHEIFTQFQPLQIAPPANTRLVSITAPHGAALEAFRLLAVRLRNLQKSRPLHKLLITSSSPKEGKSLISANLACALATGSARKILLIEGDLRCPSLSTVFGIHPPHGICEYLSGSVSLRDSIFKLENPGIWILPAGKSSNSPVDLLDSSKVAEMIDQIAGWFDWIIVDAPPTLPLADTSIWERVVDGTLLVTRLEATKRELLTKGVESMDLNKLIGTVLNCSRESLQYGDYYYTAPATV